MNSSAPADLAFQTPVDTPLSRLRQTMRHHLASAAPEVCRSSNSTRQNRGYLICRSAATALLLLASSLAAEELPCSALFGDLNGDYVVDNLDFFTLADEFGQECLTDEAECSLVADLNDDDKVDLRDVFMLSDQITLTCDPTPRESQYDENRVLYLLADMQLGGPAGNVRLNPADPNSVEAVRRWKSGIRIDNIEDYERRVVGDRGLLIVYRGTEFAVRFFDLAFTVITDDGEDIAPEPTEPPPEPPPDALLVFVSARDGRSSFPPNRHIHVIRMDGTGRVNLTLSHTRLTPFYEDGAPAWSPDGSRIVYHSTSRDALASRGSFDIFAMNADGSNPVSLTSDQTDADERWPVWSPDGQRIAYVSHPLLFPLPSPNPGDIFAMNADGSGATNLTQTEGIDEAGPVWSPDGQRIAFYQLPAMDIFSMNPDGSGLANLTAASGIRGVPSWSSDGNSIAVTSGTNLYIMDADGSDLRLLDTDLAEGRPTWSPDSRWIALQQGLGTGPIEVLNVKSPEIRTLVVEDGWDPDWAPE